jgi:murein L,D-transpeptidase YcbB/YkuD
MKELRLPTSIRRARQFLPSLRTLSLLPLLFVASSARSAERGGASNIQEQVSAAVSSGSIAGERMLDAKPVARFYAARGYRSTWDPRDVPKIIEAIKGVDADGLTPSDYHLNAIQDRRRGSDGALLDADQDILLTDAVAAVVDNIRYGKIHPRTLGHGWNADPRDNMPPLESTLALVAQAPDVGQAINAQRSDHFIYRGLVGALAHLREIDASGGWGRVTPGPGIKPGAVDPRIPDVRARLAKSGELEDVASDASNHYDPALVQAVKLFQARHRLPDDGVIGPKTTAAMNVTAAERAGQVRANLERARWVLNGLKGDFVLVNLPAFKAYYIQGGKNVWEGRTQIGEEAKQTPTFRAKMSTVVFNPDWTVPQSIVTDEIFPDMQAGKDGLGSRKLHVYDERGREVDPASVDWSDPDHFPYTLKQPPGPDNALGKVKLLFPSPYAIYLHDTPSKGLFDSQKRTFSHGCIRTENVMGLAEILLQGQDGWNHAKIADALATGKTQNVDLVHRPDVVIVYWTVSVGASGEVRYTDDIYDQDKPLLDALGAGSD